MRLSFNSYLPFKRRMGLTILQTKQRGVLEKIKSHFDDHGEIKLSELLAHPETCTKVFRILCAKVKLPHTLSLDDQAIKDLFEVVHGEIKRFHEHGKVNDRRYFRYACAVRYFFPTLAPTDLTLGLFEKAKEACVNEKQHAKVEEAARLIRVNLLRLSELCIAKLGQYAQPSIKSMCVGTPGDEQEAEAWNKIEGLLVTAKDMDNPGLLTALSKQFVGVGGQYFSRSSSNEGWTFQVYQDHHQRLAFRNLLRLLADQVTCLSFPSLPDLNSFILKELCFAWGKNIPQYHLPKVSWIKMLFIGSSADLSGSIVYLKKMCPNFTNLHLPGFLFTKYLVTLADSLALEKITFENTVVSSPSNLGYESLKKISASVWILAEGHGKERLSEAIFSLDEFKVYNPKFTFNP